MKSITLHKLDDTLAEGLEQEARKRGRSLNQTAQDLLREALGIESTKPIDRTEDLLDQFGIWTQEEVDEFNERIADLERIDPEDWVF